MAHVIAVCNEYMHWLGHWQVEVENDPDRSMFGTSSNCKWLELRIGSQTG
jgi:hypothetical protein